MLPSSPSSPINLDETFSAMQFDRDAIQSLIGPIVYNNGLNMISSLSGTASKLEASTTTLTSSFMPNNNNISSSIMTLQQPTNSSLNYPLWFVGRVVSKEFCIARKENNRYKVPKNTQFYRVRIYPFKI